MSIDKGIKQIEVEKGPNKQVRTYHISVKVTKELCDTLQDIEGTEPINFNHFHDNYSINIQKGKVFDWEVLSKQILDILKAHIKTVKGIK